MNFVCVVFELCDKMLTLSSMENLIVPCNRKGVFITRKCLHDDWKFFTVSLGIIEFYFYGNIY